MRQILFTILTLTVFPITLCGRDRIFRSFKQDQISFGVVYAIAQDLDGFIWFGGNGIYRFDGCNLVDICSLFPGQTLPGQAFRIEIDARNNLWILGYENDLYCCNFRDQTVMQVVPPRSEIIYDIKPGLHEEMLVCSGRGLLRIAVEDHSRNLLSVVPTFAIGRNRTKEQCISVAVDSIRFLDRGYSLQRSFPVQAPFPTVNIRNVCQIGENQALLGAVFTGGLWLFDEGALIPLIRNVSVYNIEYHDSEQLFWIATEEGIYTYDAATGRIGNIHRKKANPLGLPDNFICSLMQDREGGMWVGTFFKGMCYCPNLPVAIRLYPSESNDSEFKGSVVKAFCRDARGNLWIATEDDGLNRLDAKGKNYTNYSKQGLGSLSSINIRGMLALNDELWIATHDRGIDVLDIPSGRHLLSYNMQSDCGLTTNTIHSFCLWNGDIYVGTSIGLFRFDRASGRFQAVHHSTVHYVTSMLVDSHNRLWSTSYNKICRMSGDSIVAYEYRPHKSHASAMIPYHINEDGRGNIWIAGEGGLSRWTGDEAASFVNYVIDSDSLSALNKLFRVEPDRFGTLWCSSPTGLIRFNPDTRRKEVFSSRAYLGNSRFYNASWQDADNNIYIGTLNGYVRITPDIPCRACEAPDVFLTKISYKHSKHKRDTSVYFVPARRMQFRHYQNHIRFEYSVPEYTMFDNIEYTYFLKGYDTDSTMTMQNRPVVYQNLPPGDYSFIVGARRMSDSNEPRYIRYNFRIRPPFAASVWGYLLYVVLLAGLISAVLIRRNRKIAERRYALIRDFEIRKEKELYNAKILFFTNIAHEIRTPLTLIKAPLEQLGSIENVSEKHEILKLISTNVDRLLLLCTQLLCVRSIERDSLRLNFVKQDIGDVVRNVLADFRSEIAGRRIDLTLECPAKVAADVDADAFVKICSNLIGNAVKFCSHVIRIRIEQETQGTQFSLSVLNDGELIPPEDGERIFTLFYRANNSLTKVGSGIGLAFTKQLIEMHGGCIELLFDSAGYNHFRVILPLIQQLAYESSDNERETELLSLRKDANRKTVLLVEDDWNLREYESKRLSTQYNVLAVGNGQKAFDILQGQNEVSLVVSDIMMPVMDGLELCSRIKGSVELSHIPVILLTSKEDAQTKLDGLAYGADDYITKPFSMEYLILRIDNIIRNREKIYRKINRNGIDLTGSTDVLMDGNDRFLKHFSDLIEDELANPNLNMDYLANRMNVSRSTLYKKVKSATDIAPNDYIRIVRLQRAVRMLVQERHRVKKVAFAVGFSSTTYFSSCFVRQYGMSPSEYVQRAGKQNP